MTVTVKWARANDLRGLLGMDTPGAWVAVGLFGATFALLSFESRSGLTHLWPAFVAVALVTASAVALIATPTDPLSIRYTIAMTAAGPIALALVLAVAHTPITNPQVTWPLGAATAVYTFMCVRGRTAWTWLGMLAMILTCVAWSTLTGQGIAHGVTMSVINVGPLAMATYFALTIRPAAQTIFALRERSTRQAAELAATDAVLDERDRQLGRLDQLARPMLERIASGELLDDDEALACRLLERHLRDTLRAPGLCTPAISAAARAARSRGVEVVLLDDGGLAAAPQTVRAQLFALVESELVRTSDGSITIRILPPERDTLATVLATTDESTSRTEVGRDGSGHRTTAPAMQISPN